MGLFSRNKPEPKPAPQPALSPEEEMERQFSKQIPIDTLLPDSFGTDNLDKLLRLHAPMHEYKWKQMEERQTQILENQQKILAELANLRHLYQTPEKATAPSYFNSDVR